jgi:hypothetical protein
MSPRRLSSRFFAELDALEGEISAHVQERQSALRRLFASQDAASWSAQASFWEDFLNADQEYRAAVGRVARFCRSNRDRQVMAFMSREDREAES